MTNELALSPLLRSFTIGLIIMAPSARSDLFRPPTGRSHLWVRPVNSEGPGLGVFASHFAAGTRRADLKS